MKFFLKKTFAFLFLFFIGMVVIYLSSGYVAQNRLLRKGRAVVIDKSRRLQALQSPKIVLVGGSNVCYGIDAKLLQDSLHMPVVDMSINAGVGMSFYYEQVKPFITKGDIVIGIPEYGAYNQIEMNGDESLYSLCVIQSVNYKYLNAKQWLSFPLYLGDVTKGNLKSLFANLQTDNANGRKLYNEYGSYLGHINKPSLSKQWAASEKKENFKYTSNQVINYAFIKLIKDFNKFCKLKQIIYLHSVPVYAKPYYDSLYMSSLFQSLNTVRVINKPEQYLYEMEDMFDTPNHILYKLREARTKKLLEDIKKALVNK